MANLSVQPAGSYTTFFVQAPTVKRHGQAVFIDVHYWGASLTDFLFTTSVANCLIVVLSRRDAHAGAMAHFNIINSGLMNEGKAFALVNKHIASMTEAIGGAKGSIDVLLWKGSGFAKDGNAGFAAGHNYADHSGIKDAGYASVIDRMDKARPYNQCSSLLFDPLTALTYELDGDEGAQMALLCRSQRVGPAIARSAPAPAAIPNA